MKRLVNYIIFILVAITLLPSCQKEDLSDLSYVFYVRRNGADMPAYVYGNGTQKVFIVVLHGGPGGSGLDYRFGTYAEELEDRYAMVYWDQRGQGMSQGDYSREDISIDEMVEDVRALALVIKDKFGQDASLFLMGHSWGGTLGSSFMVKDDYQYMFNGWIEVDGAHDLPATYRGTINQLMEVGQEQLLRGNDVRFWRKTLDKVVNMDTSIVDFSYVNGKAYEAEEKLVSAGLINSGDPNGSMRYMITYYVEDNPITGFFSGLFTGNELAEKGLDYYSVTDQLYRIEIPTLLLWGRYDIVVSPDLGVSAYNRISSTDKELIIFENSGHTPMNTEPDQFLDALVPFLERNK